VGNRLQASQATAFGSVVVAQDVGCDAEQPRPGVVKCLVVAGPGAEGGDEGLGHHVVHIAPPGPGRHIAVDRPGVAFKEERELLWVVQRDLYQVCVSY
jgi:hypothetical protein